MLVEGQHSTLLGHSQWNPRQCLRRHLVLKLNYVQEGGASQQLGPFFPAPLILAHCPTQYREERFRLTSESTNQRVLWWSIAQTVILILTGIWQMRHLKSFFEAKKLV